MSKAEERALEAYPVDIVSYTTECRIGAKPKPQDWNDERRKCYAEGYHQAEKDLALTVEDIERIDIFLCGIRANKSGAFTFRKLDDEQYQEVLRRFNQKK